ncbi:MAG: hypothetical protein ACK4S4_07785 [Pyrinomonadaceae bacterium]
MDSKKPSVFITFERFWERTSNEESNKEIWLRLHNNTKWNLFVKAIGQDKENSVYGLTYEVQRVRNPEVNKNIDVPVGRRQAHVGSIHRIESGKSILFSVPKQHLTAGLAVFVSFSYEWEVLGKFGGDLSILHQAPFWSTDLPPEK